MAGWCGCSAPSPARYRASVLVDEVFGGDLLGAYLHGSAVLGGLRPTSDLDILVVLKRRTSATERRALVEGLLDVSGARARRGPARPVELSVVVESDVMPWRYPPGQEFLYGEWLRDIYELGGAPQPEPAPDLSILITMVLQGDTVLVGPSPAQLLDPVPHDDLIRGAIARIPRLLDDLEPDTPTCCLPWPGSGRRCRPDNPLEGRGGGLGARRSFRWRTNLSLLEPGPCTWRVRTRSPGTTSPLYARTRSTSSTSSRGFPIGAVAEAFRLERDSEWTF